MKSKRGFASMTPEKRKEISRLGGLKGGVSVPADKRAFSVDRKLASRAGSLGGKAAAK